jgi:hypothetical protein
VIAFVIERWSDKAKAWIPTGNVRRTYKAAVELLKLVDANTDGKHQIQRYERCPEKGSGKTRSDGRRSA